MTRDLRSYLTDTLCFILLGAVILLFGMPQIAAHVVARMVGR